MIERIKLIKALEILTPVISSNPAHPVLNNIAISGNRLFATNNDMSIFLNFQENLNIETTIPAETLYAFAKETKNNIDFELIKKDDYEKLNLKSGNFKASISCIPYNKFPSMQKVLQQEDLKENTFKISIKDLKLGLTKTIASISNNEARPQLTGLFLNVKEENEANYLNFASTCGHSLSLVKIKVDDYISSVALIPKKAIDLMLKIIKDTNVEFADISISNHLTMKCGDVFFNTKLLEYEFPAYERVIPYNNTKILQVNTNDFITAIKQISLIFKGSKETGVKLDIKQNSLTITANYNNSETSVSMDAEFSDQDFEITFNFRYLLVLLSQIDTPNTKIFFNHQKSACLIKPTDDSNCLFVCMPIVK